MLGALKKLICSNYFVITIIFSLLFLFTFTLNYEKIKVPQYGRNKEGLPWWEGGGCHSTVDTFNMTNNIKGYCGYRNSLLGKGQKVVTFSLHGNYKVYGKGLRFILTSISELYPGWTVRLYTEPRVFKTQLCPLVEKHRYFYICDVHNLPGPLSDITDVDRRLWRAAVMGDELVDVFLSRDLDAVILSREVDAVSAFLQQDNATLHIMRDHPDHGVPILTGMFGVRQTDGNRDLLNEIRTKAFNKTQDKVSDQKILAKYLYPRLNSSSIQHDSYTCTMFPGSVAFPTTRIKGTFVGNRMYREDYFQAKMKACPVSCRPPNHQDWITC